MHGIKEINWQNRNTQAEAILTKYKGDEEYKRLQKYLDDYLKAKAQENVSKVSDLG